VIITLLDQSLCRCRLQGLGRTVKQTGKNLEIEEQIGGHCSNPEREHHD
jgi:hypothetical protein